MFRLYDFCRHLFRCQEEVCDYDEAQSEEVDPNEEIEKDLFDKNDDFSEFNENSWQQLTNYVKTTSVGKSLYKIFMGYYLSSTQVVEKIAPNQQSSNLTNKGTQRGRPSENALNTNKTPQNKLILFDKNHFPVQS